MDRILLSYIFVILCSISCFTVRFINLYLIFSLISISCALILNYFSVDSMIIFLFDYWDLLFMRFMFFFIRPLLINVE